MQGQQITPIIKETFVQVPTIIVNMKQRVSYSIDQSFHCMERGIAMCKTHGLCDRLLAANCIRFDAALAGVKFCSEDSRSSWRSATSTQIGSAPC